MLGKIFGFIVVLSFAAAVLFGKMSDVSGAALRSASEAVELCLSLLGSMCLWSGVARVLDSAGMTELLKKAVTPILRLFYPVSFRLNNGIKECAANISANFLGLGNAALPTGLAAVKKLQDNSCEKDRACEEAILFAVLATTPFQLLPTTLATMREAAGSLAPYEILLPIWICEILTTVFAFLVCKLMSRFM